jgi:hypothetical protein
VQLVFQAVWACGIFGRLPPFPIALAGGDGDNAGVLNPDDGQTEAATCVRPHAPTDAVAEIVAAVAGLVAAWVAAGSMGLLVHPLRRAAALVLLASAILVRRPVWGGKPKIGLVLLPFIIGAAALMMSLPWPPVNALAAAVVLAFLAFTSDGQKRDILLASSVAVVVFGAYRVAATSIPWLWLAADRLSQALGAGAGWIAGRELRVGSAFAGLDFLILTAALWALYLPCTRPPRLARALYGFLAILAGQLVYLVLLACVPDVLTLVPARLVHEAVPWNFPAIACVISLLAIVGMFRWSVWQDRAAAAGIGVPWTAGALLAAALLPFAAAFYPAPLQLEGKKIVFYEKGFLNWLKPAHGSYGRLSSGMYGMLPVLLESYGARCVVSPDLSQADLEGADVLGVIFPDEPWRQGQLDRIDQFVRQGGSLLVLGEHTTRDPHGGNRFNELLAPTAMQVRFDSATFAVGGWLQSYEALAHPATAGIGDEQNQFGVVIGASVDARWPARPLLIGRWGWTDEGDETSERAMMGNGRYDGGEKLGDLVLAAEQPFGRGRIVAFGDTSGFTNAISVSTYEFTARLLAYLAGRTGHASAAWRQILALLAGVLLVAFVCRRPGPWRTALAAVVLSGSLVACTLVTQARARLLPDGRRTTPNNLAYIDAAHVGAYSSESWRPDGIGGLALTLMRNGYLTLDLRELTPERLGRAGLLVSIAPTRAFSPEEVQAVKSFVNDGGLFILTTGYEQRTASLPLLRAFGMRLGLAQSDEVEPEALGHFKSPYLESQGKRVYVRFHAAWPVACDDPNERVIAYGRDNVPVIVMRRLGKGVVLLIGDPCFAENVNLEWENGAPFDGLRENADFWRWLLTMLRGGPMWVPPALQAEPGGEGGS